MSRTYEQLEPVISALDERIKTNLGAFPTDTASGAVVSFMDGADDIPLKSLVVNIDPVQDTSSGDPSPTNICPISGFDGLTVTRTGKNMINPSELVYSAGGNNVYYRFFPPHNTDFVFSTDSAITITGLYVEYSDADEMPSISGSGWTDITYKYHTTSLSFNSGSHKWYRLMTFERNGIIRDRLYQLELGTTATDYEPYQGETYDITFPTEAGTVYGGSLDVLSGVLTVYPYYASYNGETLTGRWISDRDVYAVGTTPTIGAQVVNIGAEGTEIQLSPTEVKSLLGQNNIFADTGDTEVEYRADTKLYIERLTEPDADMIADANITSGSYFMVGNTLYKATANIASGSAVIEGTNCTQKSLSEALNEINQ